MSLLTNASGELAGYFADNTAGVDTATLKSTTTLQPNTRYHAFYVRENTANMSLYLNNVQEDTAPNGGQSPSASDEFAI